MKTPLAHKTYIKCACFSLINLSFVTGGLSRDLKRVEEKDFFPPLQQGSVPQEGAGSVNQGRHTLGLRMTNWSTKISNF